MSAIVCDHTSVGVLIFCDGKLLLIERKRFPMGFAPPAGHVDDDHSFDEAARRELQEEVGISGACLSLVIEGRKDNPCRRERGLWHYWRIYQANVDVNELTLSDAEARSAKWCDREELVRLQLRTEAYLRNELTEEEWAEIPGLEPVWAEWLQQIGILLPRAGSDENHAAAMEYAWNWFSYHAGQRQAVFRFFVILIGAILAGYIGLRGDGDAVGAFVLGLLMVVLSILFWRLDMRSTTLVKLAERSLKVSEAHLASKLGLEEIRLARAADKPRAARRRFRLLDEHVYSFRQIYRIIFASGIFLGVMLMGLVIFGMKPETPEPTQPAPPSASQPIPPQ